MKKILVIGRHQDLMLKILAVIKAEGFQAIGCLTNEEAFEVFNSILPEVVLIGGGVDRDSRQLFHEEFIKASHSTKVIDVYPHTLKEELAGLK